VYQSALAFFVIIRPTISSRLHNALSAFLVVPQIQLLFTTVRFNAKYPILNVELSLPNLELRRIYNDLIMCYKIVVGVVKLEFGDFL